MSAPELESLPKSQKIKEPVDFPIGETGLLFAFSASTFQVGLALVSFEQIRPFFDVQVSDYFFFLSLLLFMSRPKSRLLEARRSGILLAGSLILLGALLSLKNASSGVDAAGPLARLVALFAGFACLAVIHSKDIRKCILFLIGGIFVNCSIALLQSWVYPGIVEALSINAIHPDLGADGGRLQGLTSHPNVLGFCAALAVLLGLEMSTLEMGRRIRPWLAIQVFVCALAALLSGSRTFFAALVPGLLIFVLLQRRHLRAILRPVVALALLWAALAYFAPSTVSEYSERLGSTSADFVPDYSRLVSATLTIEDISEKPILGWGIDHFEDAGLWLNPVGELAGVHNSFLKYWYGAGLLGAAGFLAVFVLPARQVVRALRSRPAESSRGILCMALSCYVLLFIVSNVAPILYNRFLYVPIFIFAGFTRSALHPRTRTSGARPRQRQPADRRQLLPAAIAAPNQA
jgi:O-antigen ligase